MEKMQISERKALFWQFVNACIQASLGTKLSADAGESRSQIFCKRSFSSNREFYQVKEFPKYDKLCMFSVQIIMKYLSVDEKLVAQ